MSDFEGFGTAVQDDGFRKALLDPTAIVDVPHHDVPERHEIGKALIAPGTPKPVGDATVPSAAGVSSAPARADHVHSLADTTRLARGRLASGTLVPEPLSLPASVTTNIGSIFFKPVLNRLYRLVFVARAAGPATAGQNTTFAIKTIGSNLIRPFDHWFAGNTNWGSLNCELLFAGNGIDCSWTLQASNVAVNAVIYPFDFYVEDIGV